jgi:hypothetical protein
LTSASAGSLRLAYGASGGDLNRTTPVLDVEAGVEREVYVLGLYPGDWDLAVSSGEATGDRQSLSTSVPGRYQETTITVDNPAGTWSEDEAICASLEGPPSYVCTDRWGRPTAFISLPGNMMFVRALADGTFLGHPDGPDYMVHFDVAGRELKRVRLEDLTSTTYNHGWIDEHESIEILEGPWAGHWAVLTATYQSGRVAQGIVVFDPETLEVAWDWSAHGERGDGASIDESKLPYSRTGLAPWYGEDWLHANAIIHSVDADGMDFFWMSLRHQDWVIRIDAPSGDIRWRFGYQGDFTLVDDLDAASPSALADALFSYHQHAPEIRRRADGRVEMLVLDNGNVRASASGERMEPEYSRAVTYVLDEGTGQAMIDWSYGDESGTDRWFSAAAGDADRMPDGEGVLFVKAVGDSFIREVDSAGIVRWSQRVPGEGELYRAEYYPSLYQRAWWSNTGW